MSGYRRARIGSATSPRSRRAVAALLAASVTGLSAAIGAPTAAASGPPPIIPGLLPPPANEPTDRTENACNIAQPYTSPGKPPAQQFLGIENAWQFTRGEGQTVAVIDTGVGRSPRLPNLIPGGDFVSNTDGTEDCDLHGTVVAGLIAGQPSPKDGFAGIAPGAQILSIRQTSGFYRYKSTQVDPNDPKNGGGVGKTNTLATAIRAAADRGAKVINISEVACGPAGLSDLAMGSAVQYAVEVHDVVIVAAAGNKEKDCKNGNPGINPLDPGADLWKTLTTAVTPAWYDQYVLTVGSVDLNGQPSDFTVPGPWVGVAAPGEQIVSLDPNGGGLTNATVGNDGVHPLSGTSFATPYVAGLAALVRARFPELSAPEVIKRIEATAHPPAEGWNPQVGFGIIDPVAALTHTVDPRTVLEKKPDTLEGRAVQLPIPAAPPPPDHTARDVALIGTAVIGVLAVLGYLASFPIRRRFGVREDE
ncbi:type VII secretion-associated serine protease mycosin [Nocardia sp. CDC159]|uniref:Type VII secretion-associated serine protease mycosin n=1 Tax=Nocardia pulmonis TaxID=2951408 RepID=A0A9X2EDJ5_9NOCA|nr:MULTISPECIES: type VII secretion-associated serine protease mycosin [Nocardia]MCM6776131.1 type VII secretion-associated serine protease mycosin [Nocardia pulmonis]MCM6788542.1 type VII secretion-associated serine protease mycosin [Nocardia sp. CDC159]